MCACACTMQVRQQHLEYEHARRIEHAISSRMAPNRRRRWLRAALAGWMGICEEEQGRERDLELRLTCLRQLRVEFSKFDELSKANAFYTWFAEREKGRERERELDHRLKLLVGRFQDADKAAGQKSCPFQMSCPGRWCACFLPVLAGQPSCHGARRLSAGDCFFSRYLASLCAGKTKRCSPSSQRGKT